MAASGEATETTPLPHSSRGGDGGALYEDSTQSRQAKILQFFFSGLVTVMILVTFSLSVSQSVEAKKPQFTVEYIFLGISLLGLGALELILIILFRKGDIPKDKLCYMYTIGFLILLETIFTDIVLYDKSLAIVYV